MVNSRTLSVVMPALNEELDLEESFEVVQKAALRCFDAHEVIIINDGSTDGTGAIATRLSESHPNVRVIHNAEPRCLGGAFKQGLALATMNYVTIAHGKGGTTSPELEKIWSRIGQADLIIPFILNEQCRSSFRLAVSRAFRLLLRALFFTKVRYYLHYVLFEREMLKKIKIRTDSYAFQAEAIIKLLHEGHSFAEVGVVDVYAAGRKTRAFGLQNVLGVFGFLLWTMYDVYLGSSTHAIASKQQRT